jgi:hypothetical protein
MSNERTDEFLPWRGRLDQPDALPEQGLDDHEASWQRLAERLREKPRRRLTRYWVAAACLLFALIPAVRFFHPRPSAIALRPAPVARPASARQRTLVQKVADNPLPVANPVAPPPVVNHHRPPSAAGGLPQAMPAPDLITGPTGPSTGLSSRVLSPAITAPDIKPATDSHQLMALLPVPKKQLKVVYYNEISNPPAPSPSTAARLPGFLKFSIGRSGSPVFGGEPLVQPDIDPVLTIKLIPQNH